MSKCNVIRRRLSLWHPLCAFTGVALTLPSALYAQQQAPLDDISFRIGAQTSICRAQEDIVGRAGSTVFDRSWRIICKDAARPIGQLHLLREMGEGGELPSNARIEQLDCQPSATTDIADLGATQSRRCQSNISGARWNSYVLRQDGRYYIAEGVAAYDDAIRLGLRSIATNQLINAEPALPLHDTGGGSSYYRMEAAQLSAALRLEEGYRSNNSGAFARAIEYFDPSNLAMETAQGDGQDQRLITHDMLVNRALQLSNLGQFDEAERGFAQARSMGLADLVQSRLARNLEALHLINTGNLAAASNVLARAIPAVAHDLEEADGSLTINGALANSLSLPTSSNSRAFSIAARLLPFERATVLDAQARQIAGTIARLSGNYAEALRAYDESERQATSIREGRVTASYRMRSQIMSEKAMVMEQLGNIGEAETLLRRALQLLSSEYPDTVVTHGANAALAAFLARNGRTSDALQSYRQLVTSLSEKRMQLVGLENRIAPYFDLLTVGDAAASPARVADFFQVSQRVMRPGAASTVEQLSLQFQAGDTESAALYRQSLDLRREIERLMIQIAQISSTPGADETARAEVAKLRATADDLSIQQIAALDKLAADPKFRALTARDVTMAEMMQALEPGEAYLKLSEIGGSIYAVFVSGEAQRAYKLPTSGAALQAKVQQLRNSVLVTINGAEVTYPFDMETARSLYQDLFTPVQDLLGGVTHLIFEPDGGMLQLPINLLVMDEASVELYNARAAADPDREYDFTGVNWLGRERGISTALSAASFLELRKLQQSRASRAYLGLGQNSPVGDLVRQTSGSRSAFGATDEEAALRCEWPAATWNNPIADTELRQITSLWGADRTDLMTGAAFNDRAVLDRTDLSDFRILHFATHGILAPPAPGCPARPALLTSIAADGSDGMLEFREIFDLRLDADLVILSACDTAAHASREATREAGIDTGGGSALDGLVRAFIGAGSRTVIASHWPAPDSYQATERLMTGMFNVGSGVNLGDALRRSQISLMNDPDTSHPFYWAGFALVGDGAQQAPLAR